MAGSYYLDKNRNSGKKVIAANTGLAPEDNLGPYIKYTIDGTVEIRTFLGKAYKYDVKTSIGNLIVNSENSVVYEKGNKVKLQLPSNKIVIL